MSVERADPARQSLGRLLSDVEIGLSDALVAIFASGTHDFAAVAATLETRGVPKPSGSGEPWSVPLLHRELEQINLSLDDAYAAGGVGRLP